MTEKAADELRPEPAASVLRTEARKPPTFSPRSRKALTMPRTRDFGEPNSSGRTADSRSLTSKGSKPSECTVMIPSPLGSYAAYRPRSTAEARMRPF